MTVAPAQGGAAATGLPSLLRSPLAACLFAVAVQVLDQTMLAIALPGIAGDLRLPALQQALVISGYSIAFGSVLLVGARLGDRFGRRRMYLIGMTGFAVCAAGCATAGAGPELITARCLQGVCGALVAAQTLAIITVAFEPRRRVTAFAVHSATAAAAAVAGPVLGGILADADLIGAGWRSVFLLEATAGLVAVAVIARFLPRDRPAGPAGFDTTGTALCIGAVALLLSPVIPRSGGIVGPVAAVAGAAVLLAAVLYRGRYPGRVPVLPAGLFTRREFAAGAVAVVGFSAIFAALPVTVSTTVQLGLGYTAGQAGMLLLPSAAGAVVGALAAPALFARGGRRALAVAVLAFGAALAAVALLIDPASGRIEVSVLALPLAAAGFGLGCFAAPLPALMMSGIAPAATGTASGLVPTLQQLGSALGPLVLLTRLHTPASGDAPAGDATGQATAHIYLASCENTLWTVVAAAGILLVAVCALPGRR